MFHPNNPLWTIPLAFLPAMLATILLFIDNTIACVIINRKENKLRKGTGYHLDLLVLSILVAVCSFLGLTWFSGDVPLALVHINSLKIETECSSPGEVRQFLGVREQRVTQLAIFALVGGSLFFAPLLSHIPMPVLFGVFFYMGVTTLPGSQVTFPAKVFYSAHISFFSTLIVFSCCSCLKSISQIIRTCVTWSRTASICSPSYR